MSDQPADHGTDLMTMFVNELKRRLKDEAAGLSAAELELIRKFMADNSITLAAVKRGDFGDFIKETAEEFPFDEDPDGLRH